jgi:predicted metalloendopeptidase
MAAAARSLALPVEGFRRRALDFYSTVLTGVPQAPRWKRGVAGRRQPGRSAGQAVRGEYFPPERKARMDALVKNLLAAYKKASTAWTG